MLSWCRGPALEMLQDCVKALIEFNTSHSPASCKFAAQLAVLAWLVKWVPQELKLDLGVRIVQDTAGWWLNSVLAVQACLWLRVGCRTPRPGSMSGHSA